MPITQTPLRYPGGKSKLYNYIVNVFELNSLSDCIYVEPFAGGAGLALSLLIRKKVKKIIINDSDYSIYAFWFCVLNKTNELISKIIQIPITIDEWVKQQDIQRNYQNYDVLEVALSTFFLNRTNRSGILKGGIIGGINQDGKYKMNSRFNKKDLIRKIKVIASLKNNIQLYNIDIFDFIPTVVSTLSSDSFIYFDPPYINQGSNLYTNYFDENDHINLSRLIKNITLPWILTYDNQPIVYEMYQGFRINKFNINYSAGPTRKGNELIIFSNNLIINELP